MRIREIRPANRSVACIRKVWRRPDGTQDNSAFSTGFFYKCKNNDTWLITNWHVLTGRRPDDTGTLIGRAGHSPHSIEVSFYSNKKNHFLAPRSLDLYMNGKPIWYEYEVGKGIDIAAIPISFPSGSNQLCIQDYCDDFSGFVEPGIDVTLIGFPFAHGEDIPFPLWKRATIASEPGYLQFGNPQILVDTPGVPGMSGSAVFVSNPGFLIEKSLAQQINSGEYSAGDIIDKLAPDSLMDTTVSLSFVGIYAGSTGDSRFERLNLGRMYSSTFIDLLIQEKRPGHNPFPPES